MFTNNDSIFIKQNKTLRVIHHTINKLSAAHTDMICSPPSFCWCAIKGKRHISRMLCRHVCAICVQRY